MDDFQLVALTPGEMTTTQQTLSTWCEHKQKALQVELEDLHEHLLIATNNGWKLRGLQAAITRTERRITYYGKMKDAVEAGYLIVPNLPVTVLAVRVAREKQPKVAGTYERSSRFDAKAQFLPSGEGRYVDDALYVLDESYVEEVPGKDPKHVRRYVSGDYDAPDFPFAAVKPAVLDATQQAMARKIFDRIGMVENSSGHDPIIVGQLLDPRGNARMATFFIAWWLDTASL